MRGSSVLVCVAKTVLVSPLVLAPTASCPVLASLRVQEDPVVVAEARLREAHTRTSYTQHSHTLAQLETRISHLVQQRCVVLCVVLCVWLMYMRVLVSVYES